MFSYFFPDLSEQTIFNIPYGRLKESGRVNLLFDIDNTLAPVNVGEPGSELIFFITKLKNMGFNICLLSNGGKKRVKSFAEILEVKYVPKARKPFKKGVNKALALLSADTENSVIIGDQIFTDILCGKRNNIYAILVRPMSKTEEWFVKLKRVFEKPVLAEYERKQADERADI